MKKTANYHIKKAIKHLERATASLDGHIQERLPVSSEEEGEELARVSRPRALINMVKTHLREYMAGNSD